MNCDIAKTQFVDLLYDEIDEKIGGELKQHLEECQACRKEYESLLSTRNVLSAIPQVEPTEHIVFPELPRRSLSEWWQDLIALLPRPAWARVSLAVAAVAAVFLIIGSLSNLRVQYSDAGVTLSMSVLPPADASLPPEAVDVILARVREDNARLIAKYVAEDRQEQDRQWNETLTGFAREIDRQRENDLQLITIGIDELNQSSEVRFNELNQFLRQRFRTTNLQRK